ncbi:TfoX/Sxy family protein [bacterium]|nr:TfoX/Sxy family protein [bacterium]
MMPPDQTPIIKLKNLGPASERMLAQIDVFTAGDIRTLSPALIYRILRDKGTPVSMNLIYALEAAISGRHWLELTSSEKQTLKEACGA